MNTTAAYISELLYRYECVILPGFGAFLTRRQPASIEDTTNAFYPPKKLLSFNSQLQNNDGLLANYIASAENISYTDAVAKIQRFVLSLTEKIANGERVILSKIGAFYSSTENTLQFEPSQEENYLSEAFGLTSFASPKIIREIEVQREIYKEEVEAIEKVTPITFTPEKRRERPYLQYAAAAAIVFAIGGFFGLKEISNKNISFNHNEWQKANQEIENKIQEATFEISNPLPAINLTLVKGETHINKDIATDNTIISSVSNEIVSKNYHVVAGAFRIVSNANKKVSQLKEQGYNARVVGINKHGLHQVVYDSYENRLEALEILREIKKESPKAWLLVKEF
ncbi:HU domain-containing protein [Aquimarina pacifica]|uniref:HU domain-containing protein n=1 Tax=Aquimarina pacifica TaxID=1296415 RepID=UPI000687664C|nr:SPOR domain-containing protein [Aquimarina pacifica]